MSKPDRAILALSMVVLWSVSLLPLDGFGAERNASELGTVEKIRVYGPSLSGNLQGNDSTRDVWVYLPPGYKKDGRKYPVIYFLHGYAVTADIYLKEVLDIPQTTDKAMASGSFKAIVVMPDAFTRFGGSFYSNSPTIGDWESWIAKDLVKYIDSHYRSLPKRESRGLMGHSMGGYGVLRIGMKHPEVFGTLYAMSPVVLLEPPGAESTRKQRERMSGDIRSELRSSSNMWEAQASAWAPDPKNPPYYFDLPYDESGTAVPLIAMRWIANSPLVTITQHVPALRSLRGIMLDVGDQDSLKAGVMLIDQQLTTLDVPHDFEVYDGAHGDRIAARLVSIVLPYFSRHLEAR